MKLAQVLSTRPELLPKPYLDALARLQDDVEPFPVEDAQRIVEEELGTRISRAFSHFEETPAAAASLGQVHRAPLRDGRAVAVKVQRPGIVEQVRQDLEALQEVAQFGYPGLAMLLFVAAATAGLWLGCGIIAADRAHGRRS